MNTILSLNEIDKAKVWSHMKRENPPVYPFHKLESTTLYV